MPLTTLAKVKTYLGIDVDTYDTVLTNLLDYTTEFIEGYCSKSFAGTSTYTQWWNINDEITDTLRCRYTPIVNFIQLSDDGSEVDSDDYYVDTDAGLIFLMGGTYFTKGVATVCASYVHGYSSVPADVELAAQMLVGSFFARRSTLGTLSAKLGDFSYKVDDENPLPLEVKRILARYRNPVA